MGEIVAAIFEKWNLTQVLINIVNSKLMYLLPSSIFLQESNRHFFFFFSFLPSPASPNRHFNCQLTKGKKYDFFCPCQILGLWHDHKRIISLRLLDLGKYLHAISLCIFTEQNLDISIKLITAKEVLRQLKCSNSFIVGRGLWTIAEREKNHRHHSRGHLLKELTLRLTWVANFDEK